MTYLKNTFGFLLFTFVSSMLFQACCKEATYRIVDLGPITALHLPENLNGPFETEPPDRIERAFSFYISTDRELTSSDKTNGDCDYTFQNSLIENTLSITCDQAFSYNSQTVEAGTDFIDIDEIGLRITAEEVQIIFEDAFVSRVAFPDDEYTFTINIETDDGLELSSSLTIRVAI